MANINGPARLLFQSCQGSSKIVLFLQSTRSPKPSTSFWINTSRILVIKVVSVSTESMSISDPGLFNNYVLLHRWSFNKISKQLYFKTDRSLPFKNHINTISLSLQINPFPKSQYFSKVITLSKSQSFKNQNTLEITALKSQPFGNHNTFLLNGLDREYIHNRIPIPLITFVIITPIGRLYISKTKSITISIRICKPTFHLSF